MVVKPPCYEPMDKCDTCPYRHTCKKRKRKYSPYQPWSPYPTTPDPPYMPAPTIWMRCGNE
jgi:hypothetical protein